MAIAIARDRGKTRAACAQTRRHKFFVLAVYVAVDAVKTLVQRESPHASIVGVCLAAVSIVVMPLLARAKRLVAGRLNSRALVADSRQTDLCAYLSGILLVGLGP